MGVYLRGIANHELTLEDVPRTGAGWDVIALFALTFHGYDYHGTVYACGDIANHSYDVFLREGSVPGTLSDLRTCLFFEQRRYHHFGWDPEEEVMKYIHALVEAVREILVRDGRGGNDDLGN